MGRPTSTKLSAMTPTSPLLFSPEVWGIRQADPAFREALWAR
jgi:hypothetical protein